jgi:inner membrane protein
VDNVTHTLFGLALAKTGLERSTPKATLALLIGANLPDLDLLAWFGGHISYLNYHRGLSHALPGLVCEAFLLAAILLVAHRVCSKHAVPANFRMLFLASLAGLGSQRCWIIPTATASVLSFHSTVRWFAADLVFIVDPWLLAILAGGLLLPFLFRLIHQEIGARASGSWSGAFVALTLVVAFWIGKWVSHERAIDELRQRSYATGEPLRVGALPQFLNPVGWSGVIETEKAYHLTFAGVRGAAERVRATQSKDTLQARAERDCRGCNSGNSSQDLFGICPLPAISNHSNSARVSSHGTRLAFRLCQSVASEFVYSAQLDQNLKVVSEEFRF